MAGVAVQPPRVEVLQAHLSAVGLLDHEVEVALCVDNPNRRELAFFRITANLDVADGRLASESAVMLPPLASVIVSFKVVTTTRDLGAQFSSTFASGATPCTVSGRVVLRDFLLFGVLYSVGGWLTPEAVTGQLVGPAGEPEAGGACGAAPLG